MNGGPVLLSLAMLLAAAEPAVAQAVAVDEVRPIAVAVEIARTGSEVSCRVLTSSGVPDKDQVACNLMKPRAEAVPRREVVGFWHIPGRPADFVTAKPAGRLGAVLTTGDLSNPTRKPLYITTRYVVNEQGRVERCAGAVASDNQTVVARACAIMTDRFRFEPARLNGQAVKDTLQQSFMVPRR